MNLPPSAFSETGSAFAKATARQARGNSLFASGETSKGNKKMKKEDGDGNGKV